LSMCLYPYYAVTQAGVCFLQLSSRPSRGEVVATVLVGSALTLGLKLLDPVIDLAVPLTNDACMGFGLASLACLARRAHTSTGPARARALGILLPAGLLPAFSVLSPFFLELGGR